jgi:isoquinoline 1-oxidoreductase subunit alpha
MPFPLLVNGRQFDVDVAPDTPLLWVLRDALGLTGTKYGCGIGQCGACTVHLNGTAVRSCQVPVTSAVGGRVRTVEALADDRIGAALQQAWVQHQVPQCGYCQSGFLMAATDLLRATPAPTDQQIDLALTNLCRCGTQPRIRAAIRDAAASVAAASVAAASVAAAERGRP